MTDETIFLADETYCSLVDALLNVEPDPVTGEVDANAIKMTLADGGVYPDAARIVDDPAEIMTETMTDVRRCIRSIAYGFAKLGADKMPRDMLAEYEHGVIAMAERSIA